MDLRFKELTTPATSPDSRGVMPALARNKSYCLNLCLVLFAGAVFLKADPPKPEPSRTKEQPAVEARATQTFRQVTYHEDNTVASVQLPSGDTTTFAYDPRKRPVGVTYADGSTSAFSYDDLNRLLSLTDPRQKVYRFAYDDNGNLQSLRDPADETATLAYDTDDRPASITDRLGSTGTLVYDARGLPLQVIDWVGGTTEFAYDEAGQLIAHARPNGTTTRYGYDGDGRLSQISEEGLAEAMSIRLQRDAAGRITSAEHGPAPPTRADPRRRGLRLRCRPSARRRYLRYPRAPGCGRRPPLHLEPGRAAYFLHAGRHGHGERLRRLGHAHFALRGWSYPGTCMELRSPPALDRRGPPGSAA